MKVIKQLPQGTVYHTKDGSLYSRLSKRYHAHVSLDNDGKTYVACGDIEKFIPEEEVEPVE
jgi:hypothetical protein